MRERVVLLLALAMFFRLSFSAFYPDDHRPADMPGRKAPGHAKGRRR